MPTHRYLLITSIALSTAHQTFDEWALRSGRRYRSVEARTYRRDMYESNIAFITAHNAGRRGYIVAANRWADMSVSEWAAEMTGGYVPGEGDYDPSREQSIPGQASTENLGRNATEDAVRSVQPVVAASATGVAPRAREEQVSPSADPYKWTSSRIRGLVEGSSTSKTTASPPAAVPPQSSSSTASPSQTSLPDVASQVGWAISALWPWKPSPSSSVKPSATSTPFPSAPTIPQASASSSPVDNGVVEPLTPLPDDVPSSVDWSAHPWLVDQWPIRNQGGCGACYAFSNAAALEAWSVLRDASAAGVRMGDPKPSQPKVRYSLSEQQVLDCSTNTCNGGGIRVTWRYIRDAQGLCPVSSYPYTAEKSSCMTPCADKERSGNITGWVNVVRQDELSLVSALAKGPVVVAIQANQQSFMLYKSGVLDDAGCGTALNHAVLAVGYGVDPTTGQAYYKLRNSWGPSWGENGYIRIARGGRYNPTGQCGVQMDPTYPVLA